MEQRLVRYADLRPCTTAFVDARTPGSDRKENFTIIGPGVAENPDQYVHISVPHGFNIGGARQPPGCVNSQHSHETAEVFVVLSGQWRFKAGEFGTDGHVDLNAGDVISIPTQVFRGFENVGQSTGFMFAVLGGDNPGRVIWAPSVFTAARQHGLVLLADGSLIDTRLRTVPNGAERMPVTGPAEMARLRRVDSAALAACTMRSVEMGASDGGLSQVPGFSECAVIGPDNSGEPMAAGKLRWSHGFSLRRLTVAAAALSPSHARREPEVLLVQEGELTIRWLHGRLALNPGDTLSVPAGLMHRFENRTRHAATVFIVRGGDSPAPPAWGDD